MTFKNLLLGLTTILLFSCGSETNTVNQVELLTGRWELTEGKRNGKVTESLRDTYFEFTSGGRMSTNLPIKGGMDSPYTIAENVITQTIVNDLTIQYAIQELTEKNLRLTTSLRGFNFEFSMEKKQEDGLSMLKYDNFIEN